MLSGYELFKRPSYVTFHLAKLLVAFHTVMRIRKILISHFNVFYYNSYDAFLRVITDRLCIILTDDGRNAINISSTCVGC